MKKVTLILLITLTTFALSQCGPAEAFREPCGGYETYCLGERVSYTDFTLDGMNYRVIHKNGYGGPAIINRTKDALEVKILKAKYKDLTGFKY